MGLSVAQLRTLIFLLLIPVLNFLFLSTLATYTGLEYVAFLSYLAAELMFASAGWRLTCHNLEYYWPTTRYSAGWYAHLFILNLNVFI
jgi:hypothetical protein